jgi:hypothetical protein
MRSRAKWNTSSVLLVAPFSSDSIFITCDLNLDMRFVLILKYKHVRTAGLTVYGSGSGFGKLVHLHHSSKIKNHNKLQNSRNQGFSYYFCLIMEGSWAIFGAGSVLVTDGSGYGSGRPKNVRIRIRMLIRILNTDVILPTHAPTRKTTFEGSGGLKKIHTMGPRSLCREL